MGQHLRPRSYDRSLNEAGQQDSGPRPAALQGLLGPPHPGNRPEGTWGAQGRGLRGCGRGWGVPRGEWSGWEGRAPAGGIRRGRLPAHNVACTFLAASVARRKKWGWEGGTQARGGCWAGETAFGTHFGVPSPGCPTPGPPPGTVCGGGLLWIQWTPALPRVPEALLVCPPRPWWRVCGSAGGCVGLRGPLSSACHGPGGGSAGLRRCLSSALIS